MLRHAVNIQPSRLATLPLPSLSASIVPKISQKWELRALSSLSWAQAQTYAHVWPSRVPRMLELLKPLWTCHCFWMFWLAYYLLQLSYIASNWFWQNPPGKRFFLFLYGASSKSGTIKTALQMGSSMVPPDRSNNDTSLERKLWRPSNPFLPLLLCCCFVCLSILACI